jgi:hypothetical protein
MPRSSPRAHDDRPAQCPGQSLVPSNQSREARFCTATSISALSGGACAPRGWYIAVSHRSTIGRCRRASQGRDTGSRARSHPKGSRGTRQPPVGPYSRSMLSSAHRLAVALESAGRGDFPIADGTIEVLPAPPGPAMAVVAFTAHYLIASSASEDWIHGQLNPDDLRAPMSPRFLTRLATSSGVTMTGSICFSRRAAWEAEQHSARPPQRPTLAYDELTRTEMTCAYSPTPPGPRPSFSAGA